MRLQNTVDFSKIFKQVRQEMGHSTETKTLGGEAWGGAVRGGASLLQPRCPRGRNQQGPRPCATRVPKVGRPSVRLLRATSPACLGNRSPLGTYTRFGLMARNVRFTHEAHSDRLTASPGSSPCGHRCTGRTHGPGEAAPRVSQTVSFARQRSLQNASARL